MPGGLIGKKLGMTRIFYNDGLAVPVTVIADGQEITVEQFEIGDRVNVIGTSKGKGFAGTIKRWNFHRGPMGHGSMSHRAPGSIGCRAYPSPGVRGKKMPGQMGNARVATKNLEVVDVRPEENLLVVRGAVPGPRQGLVLIQKAW